MERRLSIIIPAFNEEATIASILERVAELRLIAGLEKEILLVNDASTDATMDKAREFIEANPGQDIKLLEQERNMGKGAAVQRGFKEASGDVLVIQDADLEYDPRSFNHMLRPVLDGFADVVYGSRFKGSHPHRMLFFWHSVGNKILTTFSNMFCNLNLSDMETCYKMFKRETVERITLKEKRFGLEPEITAKISRVPGVRIYEVGIPYYGRGYADGKKIGWQDGVRAFWCIFKYNTFSKK